MMENKGEIVIYETEDGLVNLNVNLIDDNIWLNMDQISNLYDKAKSTISEYIQHIFEDGELVENSVVRNFRTTASDGKDCGFFEEDESFYKDKD